MPIIEVISGAIITHLPLNTPVTETLTDGEQGSFMSTIQGGVKKEPYPKPDTILQPGDVVYLQGDGILFVAKQKDAGPANPMIDGAV